MAKRPKPRKPAVSAPDGAAGRKPRPDIVHTSVYLPKAIYEELRRAAFEEDCKIHDLMREGIDLALRKRTNR